MEQLFDILPSEWAERFLETEKERIELHFKDVGKLSLLQSKAGGVVTCRESMAIQ